MEPSNAVDECWELLRSFFAVEWRTLAVRFALKGLRQDKSADMLFWVLSSRLRAKAGVVKLRRCLIRPRASSLYRNTAVCYLTKGQA